MKRQTVKKAGTIALAFVCVIMTACGSTGRTEKDVQTESTVSEETVSLGEIDVIGSGKKAEKTAAEDEKTAPAADTPEPEETYGPVRDPEVVHCLRELDDNDRSISKVTSDDVYSSKKDLFDVRTIGEWELSGELKQELEQMLVSVYAPGYTMGFLMMDIHSGKGICFNSDTKFYSASSTKSSYIVSLLVTHPDVLEKKSGVLSQISVDSDNDWYFTLEYDYGQQFHIDYAKSVGVDLELDEGGFADVSAEDLARLWLANYVYFNSGKDGAAAGELFEEQAYSAIKAVFMNTCMTRSKSGWIGGMLHNSSIDAGIVYAEGHPYVLAVMSDFPDDLEDLYETVELLDRVHEEIVK